MKTHQPDIKTNWKWHKLADCGHIQSGGTPDTKKQNFWNGSIPWITPSEVTELSEKFVYDTERYLTKEGLKHSSASLLPPYSLIICTRATVGNTCINAVPMCTNQGFKTLIPNHENNVIFLYYLVEYKKKEIIRKACGSTFLEISKKDISNISVLIPPITEQQKIVEVLETWDKAIQLTRKLIEQTELQKKYLMQQLLTGHTRLKGFVTPWKTERLGHFKSIIIEKGTALSSQNIEKGPIPVIAGGQTVPYYHKYWTHDVPCITISASGAYAGFVWLHSGKIWASDCSVIYTRGYDLNFLYYCLKSQQNHLFYLQTGGAQAHIYPSEIRSLKIPNISLQEQQAIVQILNINFQEIDLLRQKLTKLEEQKKGLMPVLLTGKVRLAVKEIK